MIFLLNIADSNGFITQTLRHNYHWIKAIFKEFRRIQISRFKTVNHACHDYTYHN